MHFTTYSRWKYVIFSSLFYITYPMFCCLLKSFHFQNEKSKFRFYNIYFKFTLLSTRINNTMINWNKKVYQNTLLWLVCYFHYYYGNFFFYFTELCTFSCRHLCMKNKWHQYINLIKMRLVKPYHVQCN